MVSDGFCRFSEYPRETLIGRNCRFLQGPATDPEAVRLLRGKRSFMLRVTFADLSVGRGRPNGSRTLLNAAQLYANGQGFLESLVIFPLVNLADSRFAVFNMVRSERRSVARTDRYQIPLRNPNGEVDYFLGAQVDVSNQFITWADRSKS